MSDIVKLEEMFQEKYRLLTADLQKEFILAIGEIKGNCKHKYTHWLQEIDREGNFKNPVFKKCFDCGSVLEIYDANPIFVEKILKQFDRAVEKQRRTK